MSAETIAGILKRINGNQFAVRRAEQSYRPGQIEIMVASSLTRHHRLAEGASVTGKFERVNGKLTLTSIETLGGLKPDEFKKRPGFKDLVADDPHERFDLGASGVNSMRIIDLIAPIGKGTRQLIVLPPKAGKTVLLEQIVEAIESDGTWAWETVAKTFKPRITIQGAVGLLKKCTLQCTLLSGNAFVIQFDQKHLF
jgi:transcription termination factor Rho